MPAGLRCGVKADCLGFPHRPPARVAGILAGRSEVVAGVDDEARGLASSVVESPHAIRASGGIDVIRRGLEWVLQPLIEAEATEVIGAAPHRASPSRKSAASAPSSIRARRRSAPVPSGGDREVLGCAAGDSEDGAFWMAFLRSLRARGLHGVQLVISDAHQGLVGAIEAVLIGRGLAPLRYAADSVRSAAGS